MADVFKAVRERMSAQEAARRYGLTFDRKGWALCPFHADTTPSMSFKDGRFRCWACNESGDSIDFTARFFGLSKMDAVKRLNEDFMLGLPIGQPMTDRKQAERRRDLAETEKMFNEWRIGRLPVVQLISQNLRCLRSDQRPCCGIGATFSKVEELRILWIFSETGRG